MTPSRRNIRVVPVFPAASVGLMLVIAASAGGCGDGAEPTAPPVVDPDPAWTTAGAAELSLTAADARSSSASAGRSPASQAAATRSAPLATGKRPIDNLDALTAALPRDQARAQAAPFGLTASDGTGLRLTTVDARVVVDGPLAFTELHLTFDNPAPRQLEGRFSLTLPPGAAVSRFAMKTGGRWMEGEVVERQRARRIYEDYLHRRQDPALLEVDAGNRFRARVFPIPARGQKHLIVSWSQQRVDPRAAYRLPLVGLPTLDRLRVRAWLYGAHGPARVVRLNRRGLQPAVDLELYPSALGEAAQGFRSGRVAMARVTGTTASQPARHEEAWLLVDTSASTARYQGATLRLLPHVARELAQGGVRRLVVVGFDQAQEILWRGAPGRIGEAVTLLQRRGAMGASDLAGALSFAADRAERSGAKRVVLISDGVATAGKRASDDLRTIVRGLATGGFSRLDAISLAAARDEAVLTTLARGQLAQDGVFIRPGRDGGGLERLSRRTLPPVQVSVPGASWVWPQTLRGLQAGQSALVWAELPAEAPFEVQLSGGINDVLKPTTRPAMAPLLRRAWVRARIAMLAEAHLGDATAARARLKAKAIELSLRHRVLSPWTAFLVLEDERELRRYGIAQTRRSQILTITPGGQAARLSRSDLHRPGDEDGVWGEGLDRADQLGEAGDPLTGDDRDRGGARSRAWKRMKAKKQGQQRALHNRLAGAEATSAALEAAKASANKDVQAALRGFGGQARPTAADKPAVRSRDAQDAPTGGFAPQGETTSEPARQLPLEDSARPDRSPPERSRRGSAGRGSAGLSSAGLSSAGPNGAARDSAGPNGAARGSTGRHTAARDRNRRAALTESVRRAPAAQAKTGSPRRVTIDTFVGDDDPDVAAGADALRSRSAGGLRGAGGAQGPALGRVRGTGSGGGFRSIGRGRGSPAARERRRAPRTSLRTTSLRVVGPLSSAQVAARLRRRDAAFRACAARAFLSVGGPTRGWMRVDVLVDPSGHATEITISRSTFGTSSFASRCVARNLRHLRFPATAVDRSSMVTWTVAFNGGDTRPTRRAGRYAAPSNRGTRELRDATRKAADRKALSGRMKDLQRLLDSKQPRLARDLARRWAADRPDDVLAWVALGRALRAGGQPVAAARAWGSILDLHPSRADMRRFAGNLLEQVPAGRALALDTYAEAARQRPDHPSGYVQLALAQARSGDTIAALSSLRSGLSAHRRRGRSRRGVDKTIRRLTQVLAGAWLKRHPKDTDRVTRAAGWVVPDTRPVGMLVLTWESDANDVDLHVFGRHNSHAFFTRKTGAGGRLTADVTKGYGPELFESRDLRRRRVLVHYYRRGPMGYGLGRVLRVNHDGKGGLTFGDRPFVAMRDHAWVDAQQL